MEKHIKQEMGKIIPFIQDGTYYFTKGLSFYRRRDLHKAKKYLQRAVHLEPKQAIFLCQLAIVLGELGEYQASNELLLNIVENIDEDMNECFYFIANNYAHLGLFREAMKYAELYMEREPDGEFVEHTEDLLEILTIEQEDEDEQWFDSDDILMKQEQARLLLEKGEFTEAIALLNEMIERYPEHWSAYNNLALAHFYKGEVKKAKALIHYILQHNPGNLHALCNQVVFSYYLHEEQQLVQLLEALQKVHPMSFEHRYKLGVTFALVGRYDLAFKWLRQLYKAGFDGDAPFYYWFAYAAYHMGYRSLAETMWKKLVSIHPDKKGSEPWLYRERTIQHIQSLLSGNNTAQIFYGLYLMSKSLQKSEWPIEGQKWSYSLLRQFVDYLMGSDLNTLPRYISDGYAIVDLLAQKNDFQHEDLYVTWFFLYQKALAEQCPLTNHSAWAAAVEYVWRKEKGERATQQQMAEKYAVSPATLRKYGRIVKKIWQ
ncbi:tetratricopeptide repeat protein [Thermolongibacillus altinsuensis]|uniref:tetratricopeptide repeat protein n=1 Tax=Thermolongibacillus altinsuensis TaxID=575256 RepID=UPI00242A31B8|nr:tetratricopeptide repeat protein [Thermolongibacillus altinsuensis]GMB09082.1 TPR repeat-containing protein YvcD [Thermolongibacillus altinsuensis]